MKVLLKEDTYIICSFGNIHTGETDIFEVTIEDDAIFLVSERDHWWIRRDEFKKAIADGKLIIVKEKVNSVAKKV